MKFLPEVILIGGSAGAISTILKLLPQIKDTLPIPLIIVVHRYRHDKDELLEIMSWEVSSNITLCEATNNQPIVPDTLYLAPADYHLLIEENKHFSLSIDPLVNYSRPSIDILFESAAFVFGRKVLAILLSGANHDGAKGCSAIEECGGNIIIQDPTDAEHAEMPLAAIEITKRKEVLSTDDIISTIIALELFKNRMHYVVQK